MAEPGVCGMETEYGLLVEAGGALDQTQAAFALLRHCPLTGRVSWYEGGESPGGDARAPERQGTATDCGPAAGCDAGYLLANGARFYVDCGHPEYATPECSDPLALLRADRAGDLVLERCRSTLNSFLPIGQSVRLIKNNCDYQGHSYACHENYSVSTELFRSLFTGRPAPLLSQLVPFLVSRIVICGAGRLGSDNDRAPAHFQVSQRADFFEELVGLQTTFRRPIVNSRDEPHCDAGRFRRLHVILSDSNMAQVPTYLKVGGMQLLLAMLADGAVLPDLTLADPLAELHNVSRDLTCRHRLTLADGRRVTSVEAQLAFAEAARRYVVAGGAPAWAPSFVDRWLDVLRRLDEEPRQLAGTLDWLIKLRLLERWRERKHLPWSAGELRELDIRYHDIDRAASVFYQLEADGQVERLTGDREVLAAVDTPPSATRAAARAALFQQLGGRVVAGSWGTVVWREEEGTQHCIELSDPARGEADEPLAGTGLGEA
jgi:proteasome accessory factor A